MVGGCGAPTVWFGQLARGFLAEQDLERFVREELGGNRALSACFGQQLRQPRRAMSRRPRTFCVASASRMPSVPGRCRCQKKPRRTHPPPTPISTFWTVKLALPRRGGRVRPSVALQPDKPVHGTGSAAVRPGQL